LQIKTKIVSCHTAYSKPVKQEVNGTVILPPLVFAGTAQASIISYLLVITLVPLVAHSMKPWMNNGESHLTINSKNYQMAASVPANSEYILFFTRQYKQTLQLIQKTGIMDS
jgi:hypothetical protein